MREPRVGDEQEALARCSAAGGAVVTGVGAHLSPYLVAEASRVLDAWGLSGPDRTRVDAALGAAAARATTRVVAELRALLVLDPADQHVTPLEIVRSAVREPTDVLHGAGVPPVVRDEFDERHLPADHYDLSPRAIGDLGDPELGPALLAWGLAKARVLRARAAAGDEAPPSRA